MSYQYGQEAKQRIAALGQAALMEFIDEVPHGARRAAYDLLPKVPGFRPRTQTEFKEKQKRLLTHLIHPNTSPKEASDWQIFTQLWKAWARERLGTKTLQFDHLESSPDAGPAFLKDLAKRFPGAAREDMERLFIFSCFPEHPDVVSALECFRPASVLARDRIVDELPLRLQGIERRCEIAETAAANKNERIERLEALSASLIKSVDEAAGGISRNANSIAELRATLDTESARIFTTEEAVNALEDSGKKMAEVLNFAIARTDALEQNLKALADRGVELDGVATDLAALKVAITSISASEAAWSRATETIGSLEERVVALESILVRGEEKSGTKERVRLFESRPECVLEDIHSVQDACDLVASNLQATGIAKGASYTAARLVVAALIAGQIVQFSGSLADLVADSVAAAIGGPIFHEWRVPVGLLSDESASDCVDIVSESSSCLLLKGANLSAFEIYGAAIRDVVIRRQFIVPSFGDFALIASWAQGPAAFPGGGTLAELGPVLDTDTLPMRGMSAKLPQLRYGRLAKETWMQVDGLETGDPIPATSEMKELLREIGFEGGNLWSRVASRAYSTLRAMPGGKPEGDLHSLLVSWATPWARATGGPAEEIVRIADRELADQSADSTV
ncbi:hypothetical protein CXF92_00840 [Pseudomonas sp. Choline-3u-10]|uniref:hypothetical protein n=1 Tax=Pseudomonadaceae TaxID=135621 RepID=UPI000C334222|nr:MULTISPECIES: hypothetical protein [Pseudomonadaceae]PKG96374.1 hypothetical protein CXF92_00840 [Pseudomonas sp. Choline-3u-10]